MPSTRSEPAAPAIPAQPTVDAPPVPLLDLTGQYAKLKPEILPLIEAALDHQQLINGPEVAAFEQQTADYVGVDHAIGCSSGTDALILALMALGIGCGSEVITSPFTFFATVGSLYRQGVTPRFVDIEPGSFNLDTQQVADAVNDRTAGIMPVHLFGQLADMPAIQAIAKDHELKVIEDAAQAIGASRDGKQAGAWGDCGCFSFFPSKNLGGAGDGGMVVCRDAELAERCRMFRNHGAKQKYFHDEVGGNFRLDTLQAAYLSVKLRHLDDWHKARRDNAAYYDQRFADVAEVTTPPITEGNASIYNQYVVRVADRDGLQQHLQQSGIGSAVYYPLPLHLQPCFKHLGHGEGDFPIAEQASREVIALPVFPELTRQQQDRVVDVVSGYYQ
jgi:dTDP-4-amino-4,6-dideoxygalactose transaminase